MSSPSVPQLAARGLTKSFGGRAILNGLDLDVEASSRIGVLGPNGGGKSTMLKIIAGLEYADDGNVTYRRGLVHAYLPQIVDGDERVRVWRIYLRVSRQGFESGFISVYQVRAVKPA